MDELLAALTTLNLDEARRILATPDGKELLHREPSPLAVACRLATSDGAIPTVGSSQEALAMLRCLLDAGADPNQQIDEYTLLHHACFCGNTELTAMLLEFGADPSAEFREIRGATPLSFALFYAHPETAAAVAQVQRVPDDLRSAAGLNDVARIQQLTCPVTDDAMIGMAFTAPLVDTFGPRRGPIDAQLTLDESLTWAARNGALEALEALVNAGANVNANPFRGTALLWATYSDQADAAHWLIEHGADPNLRHDFGGLGHGKQATALHLAAQYGCEQVLEVLVTAGADLSIKDAAYDATPADWAEHADNQALADRLRNMWTFADEADVATTSDRMMTRFSDLYDKLAK